MKLKTDGSNLDATPPQVLLHVLYKTEFFILNNQWLAKQKPDRENESSMMRNLAALQHAGFLYAGKFFS
ncbi:hypothetical protein [Roseateles sp. L2-2]|uniref:hypothetical protein n=1 Tax=Roseateles sp. L2-2 TaxID=3422597 RepID=UPI003D368155